MRAERDAIVVQGMGAVSAAGFGLGPLRAALRTGRTAIGPLTRFDTRGGPAIGGLVPGPPLEDRPGLYQQLAVDFARAACREALAGAGPGPLALVLGTNLEDTPQPLHALAAQLAAALGIDGPVLTSSTACASSTMALGHALAILERGEATQVLVCGYDAITPKLYAGFHRLGALSAEPCSPFSARLGLTLGDGAGALLLGWGKPEDATLALLGWGTAADAHHIATPIPDGGGLSAALGAALFDAGLDGEALDYLNAHGTGTEANDAAEWRGLRRAVGRDLPVSSTKSILGHAQGAAGILEIIATALLREDGLLPPTASFVAPRPGAPPDPVPVLRPGPCRRFAKVSSGFGGVNAAAVLGTPHPRAAPARRPVYLAGFGALEAPIGADRVDPTEAAAALRGVDTRELDPSSVWLIGAVRRAFSAAGGLPSRDMRARTGLVVGQARVSPERLRGLDERIRAHGLDAMTSVLFTRALLDIPAGLTSLQLGLRGPLDALACGPASGLAAVVHAWWLLARGADPAPMVAAAVDEHSPEVAREGAIAVVLSPLPGALRIANVSLGGTESGALSRLFDRTTPAPVLRAPSPLARAGLHALAEAAEAIRAGEDRVAVVSIDSPGLCSAVLLERETDAPRRAGRAP